MKILFNLIKMCAGQCLQDTMDIVWPSFDPQWRIWGVAPIDPWYPPYPRPALLNMRDTSPATLLHSAVGWTLPIQLYCSVLLPWIGLGAVASDRGRRYCVKGFGVRPLCVPLSYRIYMQPVGLERYWGSIFWQAALPLLDIFGPFLSTHMYVFSYKHILHKYYNNM